MNKEETVINYISSYKTTRNISAFIEVIGWLAVVLGGVISIVNIVSGNSGKSFIFIGIVLLGLVLIITGQITRAVVDNTDANSQMLEILKFKENVKINWISENKSYGVDTLKSSKDKIDALKSEKDKETVVKNNKTNPLVENIVRQKTFFIIMVLLFTVLAIFS